MQQRPVQHAPISTLNIPSSAKADVEYGHHKYSAIWTERQSRHGLALAGMIGAENGKNGSDQNGDQKYTIAPTLCGRALIQYHPTAL